MRATTSALLGSIALSLCVAACGKTANKSDGTPSAQTDATGPEVRYIGRVDATNPSLVLMAWPGTAAETRFTGTQITASVALASASLANPSVAQTFVELTVDGANPQRVLVNATGTTQISATVPQGLHTARLTKVTEANFGTLTFSGFTTDGSLTKTILQKRKIEFIGDSITAGLGILGPTANCNSLIPDYEEVRAAYDVLTATALSADYSILAWSGKGVYKNRDPADPVLLPDLYDRIDPTDAASLYSYPTAAADQPDVVLINLGTNDFYFFANQSPSALPDQAGYTAALKALAGRVRGHYANAHLILALGPIVSDFSSGSQVTGQLSAWRTYVKSVVADLNNGGDSKVTFFEFNVLTDDAQKGCDSHPNAAVSPTLAAALQAHISSLTGW